MEEAGLGVKDLASLEYIEDTWVCNKGEGRALLRLFTIMGCGPGNWDDRTKHSTSTERVIGPFISGDSLGIHAALCQPVVDTLHDWQPDVDCLR